MEVSHSGVELRHSPCGLCESLARGDESLGNDLAAVYCDPGEPGFRRLLVAPRRHVALVAALTSEEARALWELVDELRNTPDVDSRPLAYDMDTLEGCRTEHGNGHACVELRARFLTHGR